MVVNEAERAASRVAGSPRVLEIATKRMQSMMNLPTAAPKTAKAGRRVFVYILMEIMLLQ